MSEVARLRRRIEMECEAMKLALEGFCMTARHEMIDNRYRSLGTIQEELTEVVGEEEAARIACEVYIHIIG